MDINFIKTATEIGNETDADNRKARELETREER